MAYGVDCLQYNAVAMIGGWQETVVAVVAIIVGVVVVRRVWRFFVCGDSCSCSECGKECSHRRNDKQTK